ncbi:MAG: radical SAM protein [Candidatus Tectimicrobiota bacterium]
MGNEDLTTITFVHAPDALLAETQQYGALFMPVWAYTLAAYIPAPERYHLRLCDLRFDAIAAVQDADLFAFSGINQDYETIVAAVASLRQRFPQATYIIGGPIAWSLHQAGEIERLRMFDHIFIGDGEAAFPDFLAAFAQRHTLPQVLETRQRFDVSQARGFYRPFLDQTYQRYYGAVLEVSRGCPFLCEFCDIRILPDNNRSHNLPPELIVAELDHLARLGVKQVLLACDNFIGDIRWAAEIADKIIAWQERTGLRLALYTWLTINVGRHPWLLRKLRQANVDMLFIGVESFSRHALLETAKVQNTTGDMIATLRQIQSYGFVIVAGLIFGFDSDTADAFALTLDGMLEAGLISGDPSLLTALPGTPLYRRMQLSGRLRHNKHSLGGYKYCTNMRYLMPREQLVHGYQAFVQRFCQGDYQYRRFKRFLDTLDGGSYIPLTTAGYGSIGQYLRMVGQSGPALTMLTRRLWLLASRPEALWAVFRALGLLLWRSRRHKRLFGMLQFWLFAWTNSLLKYEGLTEADFDIESVPPDFDRTLILPEHYVESALEAIPQSKIQAQQRLTVQQLQRLSVLP